MWTFQDVLNYSISILLYFESLPFFSFFLWWACLCDACRYTSDYEYVPKFQILFSFFRWQDSDISQGFLEHNYKEDVARRTRVYSRYQIGKDTGEYARQGRRMKFVKKKRICNPHQELKKYFEPRFRFSHIKIDVN